MKIPQRQIDEFVARPPEALPVEIKSWIDPTSPDRVAKIARALPCDAKQNGGFFGHRLSR